MKFADTKNYQNHLEFLGYKVDKIDDDKADVIVGSSQTKSNLILRIGDGIALVSSRWSGYDVKALKSKDFYIALNKINATAFVSKWYFDSTQDHELVIVIEAVYRDYQKASFGNFVESFESETKQYLPELSKFTTK